MGQPGEWSYNHTVDWPMLDHPLHRGIFEWLKALNSLYTNHPAMWSDAPEAFQWIDHHDHQHSVISYLRVEESQDTGNLAEAHADAKGDKKGKGKKRKKRKDSSLVFVFNFTPIPREGYMQGFPSAGTWKEVLNSDAAVYGGSDVGNQGSVKAEEREGFHQPAAAAITLPPLGMLVFEKKVK